MILYGWEVWSFKTDIGIIIKIPFPVIGKGWSDDIPIRRVYGLRYILLTIYVNYLRKERRISHMWGLFWKHIGNGRSSAIYISG